MMAAVVSRKSQLKRGEKRDGNWPVMVPKPCERLLMLQHVNWHGRT